MISLYSISIPPLLRGLHNISAILTKALAQATSTNVDPKTYLTSRLHPTMHPFAMQIFLLVKMASSVPHDLNPSLPCPSLPSPTDSTTTASFDALFALLDTMIKYLESIDPAEINSREKEAVKLTVPRAWNRDIVRVEYEAVDYVTMHAAPYFWFHVSVAYGLLRKEGTDLGKADFLNAAGLKEWMVEPME